MLDTPKHTLSFAACVSGLDRSQFSRLLADHKGTAKENLTVLSRRVARRLAKKQKKLIKEGPWTIGLIIDATLHPRSSLHVENAQRFNHGEGFVIGHQWTNIVLVIAGVVIPLPPIAFLTKKQCRECGQKYKKEPARVIEYLRKLDLTEWIGQHDPRQVLVLTDSGYDVKKLQRAVLKRGWDFLSALKSNRGSQSQCTRDEGSRISTRVDRLFRNTRKQAPWETVRDHVDANRGKKRKDFRARRLEGYLNGLNRLVTLVCSKKKKGRRKMIFLACSNTKVSTGVIIRAYRRRWLVELFHRTVKSNLGMCHAGVERFASLENHVHWVYCAYLLLFELDQSDSSSQFRRQKWLNHRYKAAELKKIIQLTTRFDGGEAVKIHCQEAIRKQEAV